MNTEAQQPVATAPLAARMERLHWTVKTTLTKFASDEDFRRGIVQEVIERHGNILLNEGIDLLLDLLIGAGGTLYNNANSSLGVGNGTGSPTDPTKTGLQGASKAWMTMDATYPSRSAQTVTWRATFASGAANFAWEEWTIVNAADDTGVNLNRKVESLGT